MFGSIPGCDWVLLSPRYVATDGDVAGWRELFSKLGVRDGLVIRKERQTLTAKDLVSQASLVRTHTPVTDRIRGCGDKMQSFLKTDRGHRRVHVLCNGSIFTGCVDTGGALGSPA